MTTYHDFSTQLAINHIQMQTMPTIIALRISDCTDKVQRILKKMTGKGLRYVEYRDIPVYGSNYIMMMLTSNGSLYMLAI